MSKKQSDFSINAEVYKTPSARYLRLELNRTKEQIKPMLAQLLELCQATFRYDTPYGSVWNIEWDDRMEYGGKRELCVDVFYTKFREAMGYHPELDDLSIKTEMTVVDGDILISWRRDDLDNICRVCRFKNGHTLRSFLLKAGFRADKGRLRTPCSIGMFQMLSEKGFARCLPQTAEFNNTLMFYQRLNQKRLNLQELFADYWEEFVSKLNDRKPLKHQLEYLAAVASEGVQLCCFDMGLGKTYTSLLQAAIYRYTMPELKVYIISKSSIIPQWYAENWNTLKQPIEVVSWNKIPDPKFEDYIVIADESHLTQSSKTARTKEYLRFCENALHVINLSGTPFKNGRPEDAVAQLRGAGVYNYGCISLDEFRQMYGKYFFYRHKDQCLDLPEKTHVEHEVEFSKADVEAVNFHYHRFMTEYYERADKGEVSIHAAHLVALQVLRKLLATGKTKYAIMLAEEVIDGGQQVVVFCDFVEPLEQLEKHFGDKCVYLKASDRPDERYAKQQRFQNGEVPVFISSYKCGGVGINLTPCENMICIDRPWTPADVVQAEDRIHRIGQRNAATIYWLYYMDEAKIEKKVESILSSKQSNINQLLDYEYELKA